MKNKTKIKWVLGAATTFLAVAFVYNGYLVLSNPNRMRRVVNFFGYGVASTSSQTTFNASELGEYGIQAKRGEILAADGSVLARSVKRYDVRIDPKVAGPSKIAFNRDSVDNICPRLNLTPAELLDFCTSEKSRYLLVRSDVEESVANWFCSDEGRRLAVTGLQIANAYAALANEGKTVAPHLVEKMVSTNGCETLFRGETSVQVVSESSAKLVASLMKDAMRAAANEFSVDFSGVEIAGMIAETPIPEKGKYSKTDFNAFAAGFFPVHNPRWVVAIGFSKPKTECAAGRVALPVFAELVRKCSGGDFLNNKVSSKGE